MLKFFLGEVQKISYITRSDTDTVHCIIYLQPHLCLTSLIINKIFKIRILMSMAFNMHKATVMVHFITKNTILFSHLPVYVCHS
jgi:hypothetical protein